MNSGLVTRIEFDGTVYDVQTECLNQRYETVVFLKGNIAFTHAEDAPAPTQISSSSSSSRGD